jgi:hypothetical protein
MKTTNLRLVNSSCRGLAGMAVSIAIISSLLRPRSLRRKAKHLLRRPRNPQLSRARPKRRPHLRQLQQCRWIRAFIDANLGFGLR